MTVIKFISPQSLATLYQPRVCHKEIMKQALISDEGSDMSFLEILKQMYKIDKAHNKAKAIL